MNSNSNNKPMHKGVKREWNNSEVGLLKKWGEQSASYRYLHFTTHKTYRRLTFFFTIPVIILSTLTGTANFSQASIEEIYPGIKTYLPLMIGAVNLFASILTTIAQFLRVSELTEAHRNASVSYGKFARGITTELALPPTERSYSGIDFILICRNEMDRLIEQSPDISIKTLNKFEKNSKYANIMKPEIIKINPIEVYIEEKKTTSTQVNAPQINPTKYKLKEIEKELNEIDQQSVTTKNKPAFKRTLTRKPLPDSFSVDIAKLQKRFSQP